MWPALQAPLDHQRPGLPHLWTLTQFTRSPKLADAELKIAALVPEGLSNPYIAQRLVTPRAQSAPT